MSALEKLAQAVLDGRVSVAHRMRWNEAEAVYENVTTIVVEPVPGPVEVPR